jgi:hypothetical protein
LLITVAKTLDDIHELNFYISEYIHEVYYSDKLSELDDDDDNLFEVWFYKFTIVCFV